MKTVYVFLADGFEEVEALTPIDVLRRAGLQVITVSVMEEQVVKGAHGVPVVADVLFADIDPEGANMLLLPGGMPGATNLDAHQGLSDLILTYAAEGKPLAAICAAPLVYGNRGLLQGKKATCYPGFETHFCGGEYTDEYVTVCDNIITGKGAGASMMFGAAIANYFTGDEGTKKLIEMQHIILD